MSATAQVMIQIGLGVLVPVVAAGLWARFVAPRARQRPLIPPRSWRSWPSSRPPVSRSSVAGHVPLATAFAVAGALNTALIRVFDRRYPAGPAARRTQ